MGFSVEVEPPIVGSFLVSSLLAHRFPMRASEP